MGSCSIKKIVKDYLYLKDTNVYFIFFSEIKICFTKEFVSELSTDLVWFSVLSDNSICNSSGGYVMCCKSSSFVRSKNIRKLLIDEMIPQNKILYFNETKLSYSLKSI